MSKPGRDYFLRASTLHLQYPQPTPIDINPDENQVHNMELFEGDINFFLEKCKIEDSVGYQYQKIMPKFQVKPTDSFISYFTIRKSLNPSKTKPLIIFPGYSSFDACVTLQVLHRNLHKIQDNYREVILFNLNQVKFPASTYSENFPEIKPHLVGDKFKKEIINHLDKIIRNIMWSSGYTKFDLMGISDGGGLSILLSQFPDVPIENLVLMSPILMEKLFNVIKDDIFNKMRVILGWVVEDKKNFYKPVGLQYEDLLKDHKNKEIIILHKHEENAHQLQDELFDYL